MYVFEPGMQDPRQSVPHEENIAVRTYVYV